MKKSFLGAACISVLSVSLVACGGSSGSPGASVTGPDGLQAPAGITLVAGNEQIEISWPAVDGAGSYNLYYATESITDIGIYSTFANGTLALDVSSPHVASGLSNGTAYFFRVTAVIDGQETSASEELSATPSAPMVTGRLNDTGIDFCADDDTAYFFDGTAAQRQQGCDDVAATHPGQDGTFGRDAEARADTLTKTGAGAAGFDFTRVCNSGEQAGEGDCPANPALGPSANQWACTKDNNTGLIWEIKVDDATHLRHTNHLYSWYDPNEATNGGNAGVADGGSCGDHDIDCDTHSFVAAVNAANLCGASDWRMPTRVELASIVHFGKRLPAIDVTFFPHTRSLRYWSSSSFSAGSSTSARTVRFSDGRSPDGTFKNWTGGFPVMLVREAP